MNRESQGWIGLVAGAGLVIVAVTAPLLFVATLAVPAGTATGAAPAYCYGYATDTPKILETIRTIETGGNYTTTITSSTASGAYAFLDTSWRHYAQIAGVDTGRYSRAADVPPALQDQTAAVFAAEILDHHDGRITAIPVTWYIGHEPGADSTEWDTVPTVGANTLTPRQYVTKWMAVYTQVAGANATPDQFCQPDRDPAAGDPVHPLVDDTGRAWSIPVTADRFDPSQLDDPHAGYPAWDLIIPEGTPVYAITTGRVVTEQTWNRNWWRSGCGTNPTGCHTCGIGLTIQSNDGLRTTYCHNSLLYVHHGDQITAGQPIALSGDTGRSGTPHVHIELRLNNIQYCPQPIMRRLYAGQAGPYTWTTHGCFY